MLESLQVEKVPEKSLSNTKDAINISNVRINEEIRKYLFDPIPSRAYWHRMCHKVDPFPRSSVTDPIDKNQKQVTHAVEVISQDAYSSGFPEHYRKELKDIIYDNMDHFWITIFPVASNIVSLDTRLLL